MAGTGIDNVLLSRDLEHYDPETIKRFHGIARAQLEILENFMRFQGLKQCIRRVSLGGGVVVDCAISFGRRRALVHVPTVGGEEPGTEIIRTVTQYLLVVFGNPEEYLSVSYGKNSPLFLAAEAVFCTEGSGLLTYVEGGQIYGSFTMCFEGMVNGEDSGAFASINAAVEEHYTRTYNKKEIFAETIDDAILSEDAPEIVSPLDQYPTGNVPANSDPPSRQEWSKTVGDLCVSAFIFYPMGRGSLGADKWAVSATMKGTVLDWQTPGIKYYPQSGFCRSVCKQATCDVADSWINVHIGFDAWTEVNAETGALEYFVGLMADYEEEFSIWKYNPETGAMEKQYLYYSRVRSTKFEPTYHPDRHVRLIGYGGTNSATQKAYWCDLGRSGDYFEEDLINEQIGTCHQVDGDIVTAAWHPAERKLYFVTDDDVSDPSESGTPPWATFTPRETPNPPNPYCFGYFTYNHAVHLIDSVDYEVTWQGNPYTIEGRRALCSEWPTHRDLWAGARSVIHSESIQSYQHGNFKIDDLSLSKGSHQEVTESQQTLGWRRYMPGFDYDDPPLEGFDLQGIYNYGFCKPSGRHEYDLHKLGINPNGGLSYEYSEIGYEEVSKVDTTGSTCEATEWSEPIQGGGYTEYLCGGFPWDGAWRAVLLSGAGRNSALEPLPKTEHNGLIIMKDSDTGELKLFGEGNALSLGIYSRAFFKQVEVITETEEEI